MIFFEQRIFYARVEPKKRGLGAERPLPTRPSATRPSYYTRGALKTRGGCRALKTGGGRRASIAHAWSPKNKGWVQSVHRPRVEPSRGRVDTSTAPYFFLLFCFIDKSRKLSKIVSSYDPHRSRYSLSPLCGIFLRVIR